MLIPTTDGVNLSEIAYNLNSFLNEKNIKAAVAPEFDSNIIENFLAINNLDDLLTTLVEKNESSSRNISLLITPGISLSKPYAA